MMIQSRCHISEQEKALLREIVLAEKDFELWAYGFDPMSSKDTIAFEFAIHQGACWYEFFQRAITINEEEFSQIHIMKHENLAALSPQVPFQPYEQVFETKKRDKEVSWIKIATLHFPFSVSFFQDQLITVCEQENGKKIYRDKAADIAIGFESSALNLILHATAHFCFLRICYDEREIDDYRKLWTYHISEEEEIMQMKAQNCEDYFHCQHLERYSRKKYCL